MILFSGSNGSVPSSLHHSVQYGWLMPASFRTVDILHGAHKTVCSDIFVFLPQKQHLSGGRNRNACVFLQELFSKKSYIAKIYGFTADDRRSNIRQTGSLFIILGPTVRYWRHAVVRTSVCRRRAGSRWKYPVRLSISCIHAVVSMPWFILASGWYTLLAFLLIALYINILASRLWNIANEIHSTGTATDL